MFRSAYPMSLALVAGVLFGCAGSLPGTTSPAPVAPPAPATDVHPAIMAPFAGALPAFATATPDTEAAYRWAATNRAILQYFQCTCGCDRTGGHKSNWNCYVKEEQPGGTYVWDPMSAG